MMMRHKGNRKRTRLGGFTLIELAIVLAVTSLLTAGLWRMMASGNSQLRDQAAADQQKQLINSVRSYLSSSTGQTRLTNASVPFQIDLDGGATDPDFVNYRPSGFTSATTNSYGQRYAVRVVKTPATGGVAPTSYSFMIKTVNGAAGESIPDTSGGRISSMIGNDGGFVYSASVCGGAGGDRACGAFGSWAVDPAVTYTFADTDGGQVASRTFVGAAAEMNTPWLARLDMDASSAAIHDLNTIQTNISMDGNVLYGSDTAAFGGSIEKLENISLISQGDTANASLTITRLPSGGNPVACSKSFPSDVSCTSVADFHGDITVSGLLSAAKLYAQQFVYDTSDMRLKHDVKPLSGMLEKLSHLNGYSFVMNHGGEKKMGVIAQELETVFPELVHPIGDGFKGVDYLGLIGPLVSAVNELRAQNTELRATIERQDKEIQAIKETLARLPKN